MEISFEGIGQEAATFMVEGEVAPGDIVTMTGSSTVGIGQAEDPVCGMVLAVKDGVATVQVGGMAKVKYSGTFFPAVGANTLACDGQGGVMVAEYGMMYLTVWVDTTNKFVVIKL